MTKKYTDPKTGKVTTSVSLKRKLREEEGKLNTFRTVQGAIAQTVVIAAYKNALGMDPTPPNAFDTIYGMKPNWKTASFENGTPVIKFFP